MDLPQSELQDCRVYGAADHGQVSADGELSLVLVEVREKHDLWGN